MVCFLYFYFGFVQNTSPNYLSRPANSPQNKASGLSNILPLNEYIYANSCFLKLCCLWCLFRAFCKPFNEHVCIGRFLSIRMAAENLVALYSRRRSKHEKKWNLMFELSIWVKTCKGHIYFKKVCAYNTGCQFFFLVQPKDAQKNTLTWSES